MEQKSDQLEKAGMLVDTLTSYREPIHYENLYLLVKRQYPEVFKSPRSVRYYLSRFKDIFSVSSDGVVVLNPKVSKGLGWNLSSRDLSSE